MSNPIIYQVIVGLLSLFFLYLMYMFTKTWRWLHVTVMFFVFVASIFLMIYAAASVRTHIAWKSLVAKQEGQLNDLTDDRNKLLNGTITEVIQAEPSIRSLNAQLGRVLLDRGRAWRNCVPQGIAPDGTVTVSTAGASGAAATPNRIDQNMILYAFVELDAPAEFGLPVGTKVPGYFLGEFSAATVSDTSVGLVATMPITNYERTLMNQGGVTWALYETMPVDGHQHFAADPMGKPDWNKPADEEPVFGAISPELIGQLFRPYQPPEGNAAASELFQSVITPYLRDGKRAAEDDDPNNVWFKVRFLKSHKEVVDSDATLGAVISSENFFDRGRANVPLLQRGSEAEFKKDDVGIFPQADANRLFQAEIVTIVEPIYVRDLHSYEHSFREISQRMARLNEDIQQTQRDTAAITAANQRSVEQITYRETEKTKLEEDLAKFQYERDQIAKYAVEVQALWMQRRSELSKLYRENHALADELSQLEAELTKKINQATLDALSANP